jgi:hypothetical protein
MYGADGIAHPWAYNHLNSELSGLASHDIDGSYVALPKGPSFLI